MDEFKPSFWVGFFLLYSGKYVLHHFIQQLFTLKIILFIKHKFGFLDVQVGMISPDTKVFFEALCSKYIEVLRNTLKFSLIKFHIWRMIPDRKNPMSSTKFLIQSFF